MQTLDLDKRRIFEDMPVPRAIFAMALPSVLGQLIALIYNLADSVYIGLLNDPYMTAALGFGFPAMMLMVLTMNFFSVGGASVISRALGAKDYDRAKTASAVSIYGGIFLSLLLSVVILTNLEWVCRMLGAQEDGALPYLMDYVLWTVGIGALPTIMGGLLGNLIRTDGNSAHAAAAMILGGLMNIALDPLFIFVFDMGVKGAAVATMLSNCVTMLYCVVYLLVRRNKTLLSFDPKRLKKIGTVIKGIAAVGAPASLNSLLVALAATLLNNAAVQYGETAVAAFGIVRRVDGLPWGIMFGLTQGIIPLVGYNYAAKNLKRVKDILKVSVLFLLVLDAVLIALMLLFAPGIVGLFIRDAAVVEIGTLALRRYTPAVVLMSIGFIFNGAFQAFGKGGTSLLLMVGRMGIAFIPALFILNSVWGLSGIMFTQPIAELVFAVSATLAFTIFYRRLAKKEAEHTPHVQTEKIS